MPSDRAEKAKANTKKAISDVENKLAHAKADAKNAKADIGKKDRWRT
jgi:hypothetical protein